MTQGPSKESEISESCVRTALECSVLHIGASVYWPRRHMQCSTEPVLKTVS